MSNSLKTSLAKKSKILFEYVLYTIKKIIEKMSESLISSFLVSFVSESLISLKSNEQPWAIRLGRSEEMSNCERIAQVAHLKWANEWISHFFERIVHLLIFGQKTSDSLGNQMSEFPALSTIDKLYPSI